MIVPLTIKELEIRFKKFAIEVRSLEKELPSNISNNADLKQVFRSSGSIGANFIEARHYLGKNDLKYHLKIAIKEANETEYWLEILQNNNPSNTTIPKLQKEANEVRRIVASILNKMKF